MINKLSTAGIILSAGLALGACANSPGGLSNLEGRSNLNASAANIRGNTGSMTAGQNPDLQQSGNLNGSGNMAANRSTSIEGNFWTSAAAGGLAEVEIGKLAADHAESADVKNFGQMMVRDHSAANEELKSIAGQKNVPLPTSLDPMHQTIRDRLDGMKGAAFDREFTDVMVDDHQKAIELFQTAANSAPDPQAKAFAAKTLPVLEKHLAAAKDIRAKLK